LSARLVKGVVKIRFRNDLGHMRTLSLGELIDLAEGEAKAALD
jgi:hypothetical protein